MLIDTNPLVWYGLEPERLSPHAARLLRTRGNHYSHVSLWELAIKSGLGKIHLYDAAREPVSAKEFLLSLRRELELHALPLEFDDLAAVEHLTLHHKDPFDRLLVVQAKRVNLPIVSPDPVFERYGVKRVW